MEGRDALSSILGGGDMNFDESELEAEYAALLGEAAPKKAQPAGRRAAGGGRGGGRAGGSSAGGGGAPAAEAVEVDPDEAALAQAEKLLEDDDAVDVSAADMADPDLQSELAALMEEAGGGDDLPEPTAEELKEEFDSLVKDAKALKASGDVAGYREALVEAKEVKGRYLEAKEREAKESAAQSAPRAPAPAPAPSIAAVPVAAASASGSDLDGLSVAELDGRLKAVRAEAHALKEQGKVAEGKAKLKEAKVLFDKLKAAKAAGASPASTAVPAAQAPPAYTAVVESDGKDTVDDGDGDGGGADAKAAEEPDVDEVVNTVEAESKASASESKRDEAAAAVAPAPPAAAPAAPAAKAAAQPSGNPARMALVEKFNAARAKAARLKTAGDKEALRAALIEARDIKQQIQALDGGAAPQRQPAKSATPGSLTEMADRIRQLKAAGKNSEAAAMAKEYARIKRELEAKGASEEDSPVAQALKQMIKELTSQAEYERTRWSSTKDKAQRARYHDRFVKARNDLQMVQQALKAPGAGVPLHYYSTVHEVEELVNTDLAETEIEVAILRGFDLHPTAKVDGWTAFVEFDLAFQPDLAGKTPSVSATSASPLFDFRSKFKVQRASRGKAQLKRSLGRYPALFRVMQAASGGLFSMFKSDVCIGVASLPLTVLAEQREVVTMVDLVPEGANSRRRSVDHKGRLEVRVRLRSPLIGPPETTRLTRRLLILGTPPGGARPAAAATPTPSVTSSVASSAPTPAAAASTPVSTGAGGAGARAAPQSASAGGVSTSSTGSASGPGGVPQKISKMVCSVKRIKSYAALEAELEYLQGLEKKGVSIDPTSGDPLDFAVEIVETAQEAWQDILGNMKITLEQYYRGAEQYLVQEKKLASFLTGKGYTREAGRVQLRITRVEEDIEMYHEKVAVGEL